MEPDDLYDKDDLQYLRYLAPMPTLPFMDIHDYDLPYGGRHFLRDALSKPPTTSPGASFQFRRSSGVKREGAELLSNLTGVKSEIVRHKSWYPGCGRVRCRYERDLTKEQDLLQLDEAFEGKRSSRTSRVSSQRSRSRKASVLYMVDECVDTGDLEGLVFNLDTEDDDAFEQGISSSSSDEDDDEKTPSKPGMLERTPDEYLNLIKESMSRIDLRTQMLNDLQLGECPPREPPSATPARPGAPQQPAGAAQDDSPYMSSTSFSVKQARKLAGLMHVDEQAIDLRDLLSWFESLAAASEVKAKEFEHRQSLKPESTAHMNARLQNFGGSDWRLPASPPIALQLANEDLQNRLANLFQEKNFLNNKLKNLQMEDFDEEDLANKPEEYIKTLRALEEEYELLGASVAQNLEAAERLEERYQLLAQELNATGNSAGRHLHDVERVKNILGPEAVEGFKKLPPPRPDTGEYDFLKEQFKQDEESKEKKRSSDEPPITQPPMRIQSKVYPRKSGSPSRLKANGERRSMSPVDSRSTSRSISESESSAAPQKTIIQIVQESQSSSDSRPETRGGSADSQNDGAGRNRRPGRRDKAVQTDDVTISSLMLESPDEYVSKAGQDMANARAPPPAPAPAPAPVKPPEAPKPVDDGRIRSLSPVEGEKKVDFLHKELEKSKQQLNFYRARNWAEKHEAHAVPTPVLPSTQPPEVPIEPEKDIGLIFVYNPSSGFHTMLSSGEVKNKGQLMRGSTLVHHERPMSAPSGSLKLNPMAVSTNNKVVSAQQVMKLIAKKREQSQMGPKI